ncbi:hypothetical protein AB8B23_00030 [Leptotrichia sp. HSP-342]|uniref:Response regulatory domain-containing protein n=1 Tax=Leptotrichia mesophila TaxID=3239303 RepID=A0AB39V9Y6_9FUSO
MQIHILTNLKNQNLVLKIISQMQNISGILCIVATTKEYAEIVRLSRQKNAGWLMITDDIMPNPYDMKSSEFIEMVNMINN